MRSTETTPPPKGRVEATQRAGTRLARLLFFIFSIKLMEKKKQFYFNKNFVIFPPVLFYFAIQPFE